MGFLILLFLVGFLVSIPGALILRFTCSLLGERSPAFGKAVKISIVAFWGQALVVFLAALSSLVSPISPLMWLGLVGLSMNTVFYAKALQLRYPRAVVVTIVQMVVIGVSIFTAAVFFYGAILGDSPMLKGLNFRYSL